MVLFCGHELVVIYRVSFWLSHTFVYLFHLCPV